MWPAGGVGVILDDWTVLAALALCYVPYLIAAREKNRRGIYDPANPRDSNALLEGWSARAKAAEANSWEALIAWVAVTFVARSAGADPRWLAWLGGLWVLSRLAYVAAYVSGRGQLRIATWFVGVGLLLGRVALAILA